jgi:hypothetical protein
MHGMPCRGGNRTAIVIIEVAVPLAPALNGGATVFTGTVVVDLDPEISRV